MAKKPTPADYQLLGITPETDLATATKQVRKLLMKYHSDRNPGDAQAEATFKAIGNAWERVEDTLPKPLTPFPKINPMDPDFDEKIAAAAAEWLLANDNTPAYSAGSTIDPKAAARAAGGGFDSGKSSLVPAWHIDEAEKEANNGRGLADWRRQIMKIAKKTKPSLIRLTSQEAKDLLRAWPDATLGLRVVEERHDGRYALFSALQAIAEPAKGSTALAVPGTQQRLALSQAQVEALKDPAPSIAAATQQAHNLSHFLIESGNRINPEAVKTYLKFFYDHLKDEVYPTLESRRDPQVNVAGGGLSTFS